MATTTSLLPVVKVLGVTSAAALSGLIASFNLISLPTAALAPTDLFLRQFAALYFTGRRNMPPLAILASTCFGVLAYATYDAPKRRLGLSQSSFYLTAAVLCPLIVPFTALVMEPGPNRPLLAWAAEAEGVANAASAAGGAAVAQRSEVLGHVRTWIGMNYVRAGVTGTAAVIAATAMVLF